MAKIYEWTYKGDSGKIIADNTKVAKREIAKKFGNAIKIPKGTVVKKIGLAKAEKKTKEVGITKPLPQTTMTTSIDESYVLTKDQTFTGCTLMVNGHAVGVGDETEFIVPKGCRISNVKRIF